jgi:hypothetical protein
MKPLFLVLSAALLLAACGDKPQSLGEGRKSAAPWAGTGAWPRSRRQGWKVGDKTSWEGEMRARTQYGQNEYTRVGN